MNYVADPDKGRTQALSGSTPRTSELARIDFVVVTQADCALAWKVFSLCEHWNRYLNAYGKISWVGVPWTAGSRLQIELTYPVAAVQNRVITVCNPPRCVGWINHVLGYTMEQWVLFDPYSGGGTRISTWIEFTGPALHVDGYDVQKLVREFVEQWYGNFAAECDRLAASA